MNPLVRAFKAINKTLSHIKNGDIFACSLKTSDHGLLNKSTDILLGNICPGSNEVETAFTAAISIVPQYHSAGEDRARTDVLLRLFRELYYFPIAASCGSIYISPLTNSERDVESDYSYISNLFKKYFDCSLSFSKVGYDCCSKILDQRISNTYNFYIEEHGEWITNFIKNLKDDISRDSFTVFLKQRIAASILDDAEICYPVTPPSSTAMWRKLREGQNYTFPFLEGCREDIRRGSCLNTFVYEQYAVPGIVEAAAGNIVIDAGAFVGDTACYFSRKTGNTGKVFAFEIVPESIGYLRQNMYRNKCENVEVVPLALSDRAEKFPIFLNEFSNSGASIAHDHVPSKEITVEAVTLDEFCVSRNIRVDFIKADIEGSEMAMLRGGANTISQTAPTCAICLYHKKNDFWEIPQYLKSLCPDYEFWFRCEAEPVLFAKCPK